MMVLLGVFVPFVFVGCVCVGVVYCSFRVLSFGLMVVFVLFCVVVLFDLPVLFGLFVLHVVIALYASFVLSAMLCCLLCCFVCIVRCVWVDCVVSFVFVCFVHSDVCLWRVSCLVCCLCLRRWFRLCCGMCLFRAFFWVLLTLRLRCLLFAGSC